MTTRPTSRWPIAACCAIALTAGLMACGNDDPDKGAQGAAATDGQRTEASPSTDEQQIRALLARVEKTFVTAGQGHVICDVLTKHGQRDIVIYGHAVGLPGSCPEVANGMIKRELDAKTEQHPSRVVSVRVRGSRATALIRIAGVSSVQQRYRKQDGEWKIGSMGLAAAVGLDTRGNSNTSANP